MDIELSSQQIDQIVDDALKQHGITEEVLVMPTQVYILALKKSVAIEECSDLKVLEDDNGRRRITGSYTFTAEDGKVKTYKVSQFIPSVPAPDGEVKKRKRSPKKKADHFAAVQASEEEDEEARLQRLFAEVQSLKKKLNKRKAKKAKQEHAAAADQASAN